ncbi:hypothetical protein GKQ38_02850 [Candidatus Nanohaloarchaea archaeon]|nr:hypothetical protein GKQ38_02850 [Candidatus Nanohaloarchaea archaeon]
MDDLHTFEDNREAYRTLRDKADTVEEGPADNNVSDYDAIVEIDGDRYGAVFEKEQAKAEAQLREAGAEVYGGREERGSESGNILAEDMSRGMTVEEAVNAGLEPEEERTPGEEPEAGTGSTNLRYGLSKVQAE